jgi:hypothetical protein
MGAGCHSPACQPISPKAAPKLTTTMAGVSRRGFMALPMLEGQYDGFLSLPDLNGTVPPAAAERNEQCRGVGEVVGPGLLEV